MADEVVGTTNDDLPPEGVAFGWVNDPVAVEDVVSKLPYRTFADTPAYAMSASDLPDHCYLWDFAKQVTGKLLPPANQGQVGSCFPANTKIRMADGSYKHIQDIKLNDLVLTAEGNIKKVTTCFLRTEKEKIYKFKCHGHYGLKATAEHPILTKRGYVEIAKLQIGDYIAIPKFAPCTTSEITTSDYVEWYIKTRKHSSIMEYAGVVGRKKTYIQKDPVPEKISLNRDFGRLIGLYLAEGSSDKNKLTWTFNINEQETLAQEVAYIIESQLNAKARIRLIPEKNTCKVILHGREWSNLFEKLCANGSGNKRLHYHLTCGPLEFLKEIYRGWMDGDGHISSAKNQMQGVTISHELALNMFDIANKLGLSPTIRKTQPKISHGVKTRQIRYDVCVSLGNGHKPEQNDMVTWRKVTKINEETYTGDVFNFEVEGDNSYVAEGIGVHNCVSFGTSRAIEYSICAEIVNGQNEEYAKLVEEIIYGGSRVEVGGGRLGGGDGSIGAWAASFVKKYGILDRKVYGKYDFTKYSETRCREYGRYGVPNDIEPEVKKHPVKETVLVTDTDQAMKALYQGWGIAICSGQGFTMRRDSNGICRASGDWAHCMCLCGWTTIDGKIYFRIDNSWGANAHTGPTGPGDPGPEGFYAVSSVVDNMLAEKDSFAFSAVEGFPLRKIRW